MVDVALRPAVDAVAEIGHAGWVVGNRGFVPDGLLATAPELRSTPAPVLASMTARSPCPLGAMIAADWQFA
jgi:hypothetical protein